MLKKYAPQRIYDYVQSLKGLKFHTRLDKISQFLLGVPYPNTHSLDKTTSLFSDKEQLHNLVDKLSFQHESGFNFKELDCVTYTESVLALAYTDLNNSSIEAFTKDFQHKLDSIRFKDGIDTFINRNHFISADWLPNNKILFEDITPIISSDCKVAVANINRLAWIYKTQIEKQFTEESCPTLDDTESAFMENNIELSTEDHAELNYIPINDFLEHYHEFVIQFPEEGAIVNIVRPAWNLTESIGTELNVSHQGLVFKQTADESHDLDLIFRHATSIDPKEVVELPLHAYIERYQDHTPEMGLNFLSISEEGMDMHLSLQSMQNSMQYSPELITQLDIYI